MACGPGQELFMCSIQVRILLQDLSCYIVFFKLLSISQSGRLSNIITGPHICLELKSIAIETVSKKLSLELKSLGKIKYEFTGEKKILVRIILLNWTISEHRKNSKPRYHN